MLENETLGFLGAQLPPQLKLLPFFFGFGNSYSEIFPMFPKQMPVNMHQKQNFQQFMEFMEWKSPWSHGNGALGFRISGEFNGS